ncbi:MAG: hypothetical protein H8D71_02410, partial [Deltaproteobacteria bacterium]|nr:hypothetical protein [Deltaproteobacteria bacterium]
PKNGSERDRLCKKQLATPASANPRFLVLTSIPEFSGPDAVTPVHAAAAGWTLLYGFDMHEPRELRDSEELSSIGSGWVAVFTDTPSPEQLGHSMLNGQAATTDAMVTGAPTRPKRTAGAPATGNP